MVINIAYLIIIISLIVLFVNGKRQKNQNISRFFDDTAIEKVTQKMDVVAELTRNLVQQNSMKPMKQELYRVEYEKLVQRYESLKAKRDALVSKKEAMESKLKFILHYAETLRGHDAITEFSEVLWLKAIDHVTICKDDSMVFLFKAGSEITV